MFTLYENTFKTDGKTITGDMKLTEKIPTVCKAVATKDWESC